MGEKGVLKQDKDSIINTLPIKDAVILARQMDREIICEDGFVTKLIKRGAEYEY